MTDPQVQTVYTVKHVALVLLAILGGAAVFSFVTPGTNDEGADSRAAVRSESTDASPRRPDAELLEAEGLGTATQETVKPPALAVKGKPPLQLPRTEAGRELGRLIRQLEDHDPVVREDAAWDLAHMGRKAAPALAALTKALADENGAVREWAAEALSQLGPAAAPAAPALGRLLGEKRPGAVESVTAALIGIGRAAVPVLQAALRDEEELRRSRAAGTLGRLGPRARAAVPALIAALDDEEFWVRCAAIEALGRIGPAAADALPRLEALARERHGHALRAVPKIRGTGR